MRIITGMLAAGDKLYHEYAMISAPSFLRGNKTSDLVLFTDDILFFDSIKDIDRLKIVDFGRYFNKDLHMIEDFDKKIEHGRVDGKAWGEHWHNQIFCAVQYPAIQWYAEENDYDWCLRVDVDSYFVGDMIRHLIDEIGEWAYKKDFFGVEQCHPLMYNFDPNTGVPTAGFVLWRTKSRFMERFTLGFHTNDNTTFMTRFEDGAVLRFRILLRPGYHWVYPFSNTSFNKEMALKYSPAYFHFGGPKMLKQLQLFDAWFNLDSKFKESEINIWA